MGDQLVVYAAQGQQLALRRADPEKEAAEQKKRIEDALELEAKLKAINEQVPTRVYNTSSSSAGAGSGDFHQYRMVRRAEQNRVKRLDEDFKKKQEMEEYEAKKREREQQAAELTAKRRKKRQKKKEKQLSKKAGAAAGAASQAGEDAGKGEGQSSSSEDEGQPDLD